MITGLFYFFFAPAMRSPLNVRQLLGFIGEFPHPFSALGV